MAYTRTTWVDGSAPAINATNLNNIEQGIVDLDTGKAPLASPTFTGTVTLPSTTSIGNVSSTELGYVDGVTSAIQTQLNAKAPLASPTFTGTVTAATLDLTTAATATTATSYFVETGSDGVVRPKTLANVRTEVVTASDVLTKIKTVDGASSGLDADLLDGNEASAFALSGHNHTGTYQPLDADLTAIAGQTGTGFLKRTGTDTWSLDTTTYAPLVSPSFTTPTLGVATATSINKVAITAPATSATLTIANGGTLATSGAYSITLTASAATNVTLPTSGTLVNTSVTTLSSLASVGTITTGTWNATAIADGKIASALTGKTYNGLSLTAAATGFTIAGGTTSKTLTVSNTLTLAGTDASTLNIGTGGTLGTAAFTASTAYAPAAGSSSIVTVGTVTSGTWNGSVIDGQRGGTGVANTGKTITVSGNTTIGSSTHTVALATSGNTSVTLPTSGTLATTTDVSAKVGLTGDETVAGTKTFSGAVALSDVGKLYVGPQTYASDAAFSAIEDGNAILYLVPNGSTETSMIRAWGAGGTWASRSAVAASRSLLQLDARGYSGSNYRAASRIEFSTDDSGTFSDASMPGKIVFSTTANGSISLTERLRIDSAGKVTIGTVGDGAGIALGSGGPTITSSSATPESAITAPVGSKHRNTTTGIDFIKRTGTGNTGWVPTARVTVSSTAPSSPVDGDLWVDISTPSWTAFTYSGSPVWSSYHAVDSSFPVAGYMKDANGFVHFRGAIRAGSGTITTLPTGYRPTGRCQWIVYCYGTGLSWAIINLLNTGVLSVVGYASGGNNTFVSLEGLEFATF